MPTPARLLRANIAAVVVLSLALGSCSATPPTPASVPIVGSSGGTATVGAPSSPVPSPRPPDGPFELAHGEGPADGRNGVCTLGWGTEGELVVDPSGGTAVIVEAGDFGSVGDTLPVVWWPMFSGRRVGDEVEILDPGGNVVATTGRRYRIEAAWPMGGDFIVCGGDVRPLPTQAEVLAQAAPAYLAAEREFVRSNERAFAAYNDSSKNLKAGKKLHHALANNDVAFSRNVERIDMPYNSRPVASRLMACHVGLYHREQAAQFAKSVADYNKYRAQTEDKSAECFAIANDLRITLGLPEVPS